MSGAFPELSVRMARIQVFTVLKLLVVAAEVLMGIHPHLLASTKTRGVRGVVEVEADMATTAGRVSLDKVIVVVIALTNRGMVEVAVALEPVVGTESSARWGMVVMDFCLISRVRACTTPAEAEVVYIVVAVAASDRQRRDHRVGSAVGGPAAISAAVTMVLTGKQIQEVAVGEAPRTLTLVDAEATEVLG